LLYARIYRVLGASPDGKVIDLGCRDPYGLGEVKCSESKFRVTSIEACSDPNFFLELVDGKPRLKHIIIMHRFKDS